MIDKLAWLTFKEGQLLCACSQRQGPLLYPGGKREPGGERRGRPGARIEEELAVRLTRDSPAWPANSAPRPTASRRGCW